MQGPIVLCFVCAFAVFFVLGQNFPREPISDLCLGCICEASSNCNLTMGCDGDVCGLFRITWAYWADANKVVLKGDDPNRDGAYPTCVKDAFCAAQVVRQYMDKFSQDCNGDGAINCDDYARIHRLGGYGCTGNMDVNYRVKYESCMQQLQLVGGRK